MCAAQLGNLDLVKELLQREADVRAMDEVRLMFYMYLSTLRPTSFMPLPLGVVQSEGAAGDSTNSRGSGNYEFNVRG